MPSGEEHALELNLLLIFTFVPLLASTILLPFLVSMERDCCHLVRAFDDLAQPVAVRMLQLFDASRNRRIRGVFSGKAAWYLFCIAWAYFVPPCSASSDVVYFWEQSVERVPCEIFGGVCTLLCILDSALCCVAYMVPNAVDRYRRNFTPTQTEGLSRDLLQWLPAYQFGDKAAPKLSSEPTCSICLADFDQADKVRPLPCGHHFHVSCVDTWLIRTASCPMRCHTDIVQAARVAKNGGWAANTTTVGTQTVGRAMAEALMESSYATARGSQQSVEDMLLDRDTTDVISLTSEYLPGVVDESASQP